MNQVEHAEISLPLISVIIPIYNVQDYLGRCLESVTGQDYRNLEILLIDDGSTDRSGEICDQWSEKDCRIQVIHKEHNGPSDARNCGLDCSTGEYISYVDSDDYVETTYLTYLYELINRSEKCKVSQANHTIIRGEKREKCYSGDQDHILSRHNAAEAVLFHDRVDVAPWGKLYHRSVFNHLRYPQGKIYEDTYIFADVLMRTDEYVYGHISQYNYVQNAGSIVNQAFTKQNLEYIEASERMTQIILAEFPDLEIGCIRRMNYACLNVLRYMRNCAPEYRKMQRNLRILAIEKAKKYINYQKTPRRDKAAIVLLKLGLQPFYLGWKIHVRSRNGRKK